MTKWNNKLGEAQRQRLELEKEIVRAYRRGAIHVGQKRKLRLMMADLECSTNKVQAQFEKYLHYYAEDKEMFRRAFQNQRLKEMEEQINEIDRARDAKTL